MAVACYGGDGSTELPAREPARNPNSAQVEWPGGKITIIDLRKIAIDERRNRVDVVVL